MLYPMMKRYTALVSLLLMLFFLAGCQTATLRSAGGDVNAYPAMWLAEKNGSKVYLFGSYHKLPSGVRWYTPAIATAFENADELVIESNASPEEVKAALEYVKKNALLPGGQTLDQLLAPAEYAKVREIAEFLEIDESKVARMQPWFLDLLLEEQLDDKLGIETRRGVETLFVTEAEKKQMKISSLETAREQIVSLSSTPLELQLKDLSDRLGDRKPRQAPTGNPYDSLNSWVMGDTDRLGMQLSRTLSSADYRNLIIDRNRKWLPQVEGYLEKPQQTMIVVGTGHLTGEWSVIRLLKRRGHAVTRIQ